jgi:transposase
MTQKEVIVTGRWSLESLEVLISSRSSIADAGKRVAYISGQFLGVRYQESTLIGDIETEEVFTINLESVDCFTLIDYVEAMRLSFSFSSFRGNLKRVRYQNGIVSFEKRNHFFTDWLAFNTAWTEDVTCKVGLGKTRSIKKQLNIKEDGQPFVPGIRSVQRDISYIPSSAIDDAVTERLNTGDYIGIYSGVKGLDVSHAGIFIRDGNSAIFRHASSKQEYRKVLDEDFIGYVSSKPGIVVIRPRAAYSSAG